MTSVIKYQFGDGYLPYVQFGNSRGTPLVIIPGLSDGLDPMAGTRVARLLKWWYRSLGQFRVIVPSRPVPTPMGKTTRDMADDLFTFLRAKKALPANIVGLSMGGFIAQYLALDHPDAIRRLVLGVSIAHVDKQFSELIERWEGLLQSGQWSEFQKTSVTQVYTPKPPIYYRLAMPFLGILRRKPRDIGRYLAHAAACKAHDSRQELGSIQCPTLVIGGETDLIARPEKVREMAELIPGAKLEMLPDCGHGAFEQKYRKCNQLMHSFLGA